jgi:predicted exporter
MSKKKVLFFALLTAGWGWSEKKVYLKKLMEVPNEALIQEICRKCDYSRYDVKNRFIVYGETQISKTK